MSNYPYIKDFGESTFWKYVVGSPNFIIMIHADFPQKGVYEINPIISINSKLNPVKMTHENTEELNIVLAKAIEISNKFKMAAKYDEKFVGVGRTVWLRNNSEVYQIVGIFNVQNKEYMVKKIDFPHSEASVISLWDMIPIVEPIDV